MSGWRVKLDMHARLAKGGSLYIRELVDYPGIFVADNKETRDHKTVRTIAYGESKFETIDAAVAAWNADNGAAA